MSKPAFTVAYVRSIAGDDWTEPTLQTDRFWEWRRADRILCLASGGEGEGWIGGFVVHGEEETDVLASWNPAKIEGAWRWFVTGEI